MTSARDQQIRALYRAALAQPPAERASFVAELTGEDEELRKSVELMLSQQGTDVGARPTASPEYVAELAAGTEIGQYRIQGVLGRGGIGVVYRATDTKLNRPVAIKFLASAVADADARRRFKQEAETASALNHPHIVTVYDVGEHDGRQYIVSELVDGGTLDDWAAAAKRSSRQSVELLTGVADALAAAHAAGVLHRDVKPGNILIGANGYAKLADFGLAKLVGGSARDRAATPDSRNTRAGVVVGTVAYMSPEQAAGQPLDSRSDVFSFGIVLYELVAGRRPFAGANELEVLKSIAHAAPAPLPDSTPELLRIALDKALEKEPGDRYQTMQDFVADLKRATRRPGSQSEVAAVTRRGTRLPWLLAAGFAAAFVAAIVPAALYFRREAPPPTPQMRFEIPVPSGYTLGGLALSPNGQQLAYVVVTNGVRQIWLRPIGATTPRVLAGTEGAIGAFWSPDSRSLAFYADLKLKRIDAAGGPAQTITDTSPVIIPGQWTRDGTILFSGLQNGTFNGAISQVPANGGAVTLLTAPRPTDPQPLHVMPRMLPDGKHLVYVRTSPANLGNSTYYVASLEEPTGRPLLNFAADFSRMPNIAYFSGFLLYLRDGALLAQRFDLDALAFRSDAIPIADNVAEFTADEKGTLVYHEWRNAGPPAQRRQLAWFDRGGRRLGEIEAPPWYRLPSLSPDGRRVAFGVRSQPTLETSEDIWTFDAERGTAARLTFDDAADNAPIWSPDGTRIVFAAARGSGLPFVASRLYQRAANGAGTDELLFSAEDTEFVVPFDWSRDGRFVLFGRGRLATAAARTDIWVLPMTGDKTVYPLLESPFRKGPARFSPDGKWIAYGTNESNGYQVVVRPFPEIGKGQWQVSTRGGYDPRWRSDGRELYYLAPDGTVMAVDVQAGDAFETGPPRALFATGMSLESFSNDPEYLYDVTADGQRFLINEPIASDPAAANAATAAPAPLNVIVNWTSGLEAK